MGSRLSSLLGVVIPFFIGRGIIGRAELAGILGTLYSLTGLVYSIMDREGMSASVLVLLWLAISSAAATVEMQNSE